jgi:hypothetical protein
MPFKSQAQRRKFAALLVEGKISPQTFEEWNRETGSEKLPEHVKKKRASRAPAGGRRKSTGGRGKGTGGRRKSTGGGRKAAGVSQKRATVNRKRTSASGTRTAVSRKRR